MAATKNASTKKKVAVVAKKSQEVKVRLNKSVPPPAAKVIPLPNDWPVASRPPALKSTDSALRPGSLLQEVCNGQDIHLNKQSLQAPSISKEKGRYLFILPGNMSFRSLKRTSKSMGDEVVEKSDDLVEKKSTEDGDDEEGEGTAKDDEVSSKIAVPSLGKIEGLSTLNPKLRVAFPDSNKALVFPGTKVNTLSKFMWLNCSGRKKGTVACKGIFTAAIVFGTPTWETSGDEAVGDFAEPSSRSTVDDDTRTHYGGSERTVDGVFKGSKKKKSIEAPGQAMVVPIVSKERIIIEPSRPISSGRKSTQEPVETMAPIVSDEPIISEPSRRRTTGRKSPTYSSDEDVFSIDDDDDKVVDPTPSRRSSTRSSAKKTSYKEKDESDEGEESEGDDSAVEAPRPKKRKVSRGGRQKSDPIDLADSDESENKGSASKKPLRTTSCPPTTTAKSNRIDLTTTSVVEGLGSGTRASSSKQKTVESPSISSVSSPFRSRRRRSPGAPKLSSAKRSIFDLTAEFQFE